jgi:CubicO group peptidase (beta-lactamase class C family)
MTALCIMALVEEGQLSLEDRIDSLLPDLALHGHGEELTVRHLLAHTGGIGEAPNVQQLQKAAEILMSSARRFETLAELYPDGIEVEVRPGSKWAYANHGYALLGAIAAKKDQLPLDEVFRKRIFDPLGMRDSDLLDRRDPSLSKGYIRNSSGGSANLPVSEFLHIRGEFARAAGGGQATLRDMAIFASAMLRQAEGVVHHETFSLMTRPHWCVDERLTSQGFGFVLSRRFGRSAIVHGGGIQGWVTMLTVLPSDGLALVTFLNLASADFGPVDSSLLKALLDAPEATVPELAIDQSILATAPGMYECKAGILTNARWIRDQGRISIERIDNCLYLRAQRGSWSGGVRLLPADESDPAFFTVDSNDIEPSHIAFFRARAVGAS